MGVSLLICTGGEQRAIKIVSRRWSFLRGDFDGRFRRGDAVAVIRLTLSGRNDGVFTTAACSTSSLP